MYVPFHAWLLAFVITVMVEIPIVLWLLRRPDLARPRLAALVVFANLATHPAVWFIAPQLFYAGTVEYQAASETWAVTAEALFYVLIAPGLGPSRALGVSLVANGASFLAGLAVTEVWPQAFY